MLYQSSKWKNNWSCSVCEETPFLQLKSRTFGCSTFTCISLLIYWHEMNLLTRHIKQGKTSTWIVSTKLCICVWQAMKLLNFFHPYPFKIFFSLSYCLLHSLWPILDLILTSSRPRLFFPCVLYRVKIVLDIK